MDEPTKHAGLAHLFEHYIHAGSKRMPGQHTFNDTAQKIGADTNAYTAPNRIFYFGTFHPDALREWMQLQGATVSEPEWNEETFIKEKGAVKDEASTNQKDDQRILGSSIRINLLPKGHPLAMYEIGTQEQLNAMTIDDVKTLFYSNYVPGVQTIIFAGNFDPQADGSVLFSEEDVQKLIEQNYLSRKAPRGVTVTEPNSKKVFPSIVDQTTENQRIIEIGTELETARLELLFEVSEDVMTNKLAALEILNDYLNLRNEGSLSDRLVKKGWIVSLGSYVTKINNLGLLRFIFMLTPEGMAHRYEVPNLLFKELGLIDLGGLSQEMIHYLRLRNISNYTNDTYSASKATELVGELRNFVLDKNGNPEYSKTFDFESRYAISNKEIRDAANGAFNADKLVVGYIGPDVKSEQVTPIFDRPMRLLSGKEQRRTWKKWQDVQPAEGHEVKIAHVPLEFSEKPQNGVTQSPRIVAHENATLVLEENHNANLGGIAVNLTWMPKTAKHQAALKIWSGVFGEIIKGERDYIASVGIKTSIKDGLFSAHGNPLAARQALEFLITNWRTLRFPADIVELVRKKIVLGFERSQQSHAAFLAFAAVRDLSSKVTPTDSEVIEEVKSISIEEIQSLVRECFDKVDLHISMVGDYTEGDITRLTSFLRTYFPRSLTDADKRELRQRDLVLVNSTTLWQKPTVDKKDAIGHARLVRGPIMSADVREHAAFSILTDKLGAEVHKLNRAEKELGYVHSATRLSSLNQLSLVFYGQTDGASRFPEIATGWDELSEAAILELLSEDGFESEKVGLYRSGRLVPDTLDERAESLLWSTLLTGDPNHNDRVVQALQNVTVEDVTAVAKKYLEDTPAIDAISSGFRPKVNCRHLLVSIEAARKRAEGTL